MDGLGRPSYALRVAATLVVLVGASTATAHDVPPGKHNRTIAVHLTPDLTAKEVRLTVNYRLEVHEQQVQLVDMKPYQSQVRLGHDYFSEFMRIYGEELRKRLLAKADGQAVSLKAEPGTYTTKDENGVALGHLRCEFRFTGSFPLRFSEQQTFTFHDDTYLFQAGQIKLTWDLVPHKQRSKTATGVIFIGSDWVALVDKPQAPDPAAKSPLELDPGADRDLVLPLTWGKIDPYQFNATDPGKGQSPPAATQSSDEGPLDLARLFRMFLASDQGVIVVLLLSVVIGAAHALTPGHGKTLVAAYLVGQRGTVAHACLLGLVTTITHTGIVLLIALGLLFVDEESRQSVAQTLGLGMGIVLVCLGIWLLLQRLAGRADHFHLPGHGHHHHHHGDHHHHEPPPSRPLTWVGLIVMGMTGGIAPCWDAVAMLVVAIGLNLLWLALPMLLAFSAGLAAVLVIIGILVVHARKLIDAGWSESRLVKLLPIFSALFIAAMGVLVCYQSAQGEWGDRHDRPAAVARP
jgi:ABC-type nickel/cobalt efflux system permease component RcnA